MLSRRLGRTWLQLRIVAAHKAMRAASGCFVTRALRVGTESVEGQTRSPPVTPGMHLVAPEADGQGVEPRDGVATHRPCCRGLGTLSHWPATES